MASILKSDETGVGNRVSFGKFFSFCLIQILFHGNRDTSTKRVVALFGSMTDSPMFGHSLLTFGTDSVPFVYRVRSQCSQLWISIY